MKRKQIIAIIIGIVVIVSGFGGYKIYADQQIENKRVEKLNSVKKIEITKDDLKYLEDKKLVDAKILKEYKASVKKLDNKDLSIDKITSIESELLSNIKAINTDLKKQVDLKKDNNLKKVNKLKAKTKVEKKSKTNIKSVINKKVASTNDDLKNINSYVKKHKNLVKQESKIKSLKKTINKRIAKENAASQSSNNTANYTGGSIAPNYSNPGSNNSSGGSNNSGGGNNNSGNNGRPDWYNEGGSYCVPNTNGNGVDCIEW